ncbi:CaiB/BaiF CoA-transferase family protein [soil metagenome]
MDRATGSGPLTGVRVLEFAGIGPAPFCGMLLSDLGAEVVRIDRPGARDVAPFDVTNRGRRTLRLDLKSPDGVTACLKLIAGADILIEGFRPGVMERLGLGPEPALAANRRLVFGRMTGWGQTGPFAQAAGHDMNYIALSGALHAVGTEEKPIPPLNLVGDFGGGALYLAFGVLAALTHARTTGEGQVVDVAMTDGSASLMAMMYGFKAMGMWRDERRSNLLDGGAPFYDTYRCADGGWLAVGALEPQFYAALLSGLEIDAATLPSQMDRDRWGEIRSAIGGAIATRGRDAWMEVFAGTDACVAPVLTLAEAPHHPQNVARGTFASPGGVDQPAPAPRFSATPGTVQAGAAVEVDALLAEWAAP